jgi:hypothetical protein
LIEHFRAKNPSAGRCDLLFQIGGVVWMVQHALAPGQSGNLAQRRLYVDLVACPPGQLPRLAQGAPAAALA